MYTIILRTLFSNKFCGGKRHWDPILTFAKRRGIGEGTGEIGQKTTRAAELM
jgi:hypothetical protein